MVSILGVLEFGHRWGWVLWIVTQIGLYAGSRRWVREDQKAQNVHVVAMGRRGICVALTFICFGFVFAVPSKWALVAESSIVGALSGLYVAWRDLRKRDLQLQTEGKLAVVESRLVRSPWFKKNQGMRLFLVMPAILLTVLIAGCLPPGLFETMLAPAPGLAGGFILAIGTCMRVWAKRRERQGFSPLVFPIRRG